MKIQLYISPITLKVVGVKIGQNQIVQIGNFSLDNIFVEDDISGVECGKIRASLLKDWPIQKRIIQ